MVASRGGVSCEASDCTWPTGRVLEEGRLLYSADEPGRLAFEVRTRSEHFNFLPTQRAHRDQFLRRVAAGGLGG